MYSIEKMEAQGSIQFCPLNMLRGRSIRDTIVLVDEAQNLSISELRMLGTRIGEGSRLFLLGDDTQSDERHKAEGLRKLISSPHIISSPLVAHIHLEKNERSGLSELIDLALYE